MTESKLQRGKIQLFHVSENEYEAWNLIKAIPNQSKPKAYLCAILNLLWAGSGTLVCAFMVKNMDKTQALVGISQMLLAPWLIGVFWSYYWAYLFITRKSNDQETTPLVGGGTNSSMPL